MNDSALNDSTGAGQPSPVDDGAVQSSIRTLPGPILVLGASGFVGANLLRAVLEVRDDVVGTYHNGTGWRLDGIEPARLRHIDITLAEDVVATLSHLQPGTVFNCVAFGAYPFQNDTARIYETNLVATAELLEQIAEHPVKAFVNAGSSSEYGLNGSAPGEAEPLRPNSHYAVSKAGVSHLIHYFGVVRKVPCINLRLYSVYGPYEDSSRLVPNLVEHGLRDRFPPLVSPDIARDFVHTDDVVYAFALAAQGLVSNPDRIAGNSYNIGTGRKTTIRDMAALSRTVFGMERAPEFGDMAPRAWDLEDWFADPAAAERDLGWRARISLRDGFERTASWWRDALRQHAFSALTEQGHGSGAGEGRTPKSSVSAIVACYRDGDAIPIMHERLVTVFERLDLDYEILFVNDGSPDDSTEVIRALSSRNPRVIGICHARNFGSQAAFRSGMELASKQACVLLDGDLQDPPELIEAFVERWREGYDVVYGDRTGREMPRLRHLLYRGFYKLFSALSDIPVPRDAGDFSLIDTKAVRWILSCNERDSFLRGLRAYVGFRQIGVPYFRPERVFGQSTNNLFNNIRWAKKGIFSFSAVPLDTMTLAAVALLVMTGLAALLTIAVRLVTPHLVPPGLTTVILAIMFFGSLNLFGIALLGEYIGKIMQEVKGRPHFVRESVIRDGSIVPDEPK